MQLLPGQEKIGQNQNFKMRPLLDASQQKCFDDLARLASLICGTPISLITFIEGDRQRFKSHIGWDIDEIPLEMSFCVQTILQKGVRVIHDTLSPAQITKSPLATNGGIRFYAGVPLITDDGYPFGTLCVMDSIPRALTEEQVDALEKLADQVVLLAETGAMNYRQAAGPAHDMPSHSDLEANLYRGISQSASDAIIVIDAQSKIVFANRATCALFGYEAEELKDKQLTMLMPEYLRGMHQAAIKKYIEIGQKHLSWDRVELLGLHKNGNEIPVEISFSEMVIEGKHLLAGICRNVSARKRLEQDRLRLAAIVEWADDAIIGQDLNGIIQTWNRGAERIYGYSADEVIGKHVSMLAPPERAAEISEILAKLKRGERIEHYETIRLTKSGKCVQMFETVSPICDETGTIIGASAVGRDITERNPSEERYRSLVEGAVHAFFRMSSSGQLLEANPAMAWMLGYGSVEELLRCNTNKLFAEDTSRLIERWTSASRIEEEVRWHRRDGGMITVRLTGRPLADQSSLRSVALPVQGFEFIAEDVTELRAMEAELRQARKMEAVGQLAGGIAHEFNNFLGIILGYNDLLSQEAGGNEELRQNVAEIKAATQRAASLTRQLLAFSRKQVVEYKLLDLNELIWESHKLLRRLVPANIEIVPVLDPTLRRVGADPGEIQQILFNLVINARDAMPEGGKITIETRNQDIDETFRHIHPDARTGSYVTLSVRDTRSAMDAETMAHILEPFPRTTETERESDLGLSAVYNLVRRAGGFVTLNSPIGKGSVLEIYLSCEARSSLQASLAHSKPPVSSETILVVEDESALRRLLGICLEKHGYRVLMAKDGAEGLDVCRRHVGPLHLIITDIMMPHLNGLELRQRVEELRPGTRFLFMSGYSEGISPGEKLLMKGSAFLEKPFLPEQLVARVRELMGKEVAA